MDLSILGDIYNAVKPFLPKEVQEIAEQVEKAITDFPAALSDWARNVFGQDIKPIQDFVIALTSSESGIGQGLKLIVGDVIFQVVTSESVQFKNDVPLHPVEDRRMIADHTWRQPVSMRISGMLIGYPVHTQRHKDAMEALVRLREEGVPFQVICDFPPGTWQEMVIQNLQVSRSYPNRNAYDIDLELVQAQYVFTWPDMSGVVGQDPGSGLDISSDLSQVDSGLQPATQSEAPPKDFLGNFLANIGKAIDDLSKIPFVGNLINQAKSWLRENVPGAALVMDLLSGNLSAQTLLETAASFIPGAGAVLNTVSQIAGALQQTGVLDAVGDLLSGKGSIEQIAAKATAAVVNYVGQQVPALSGICSVVSSILGG